MVGGFVILFPLLTNYYARCEQQKGLLELQSSGIRAADLNNEYEVPKRQQTGNFLLEIPDLDLSVIVTRGTSPENLKKFAGWYEESAAPGEGNTAIAAHRTMYGAWFRHLDKLKKGALINIKSNDITYIYEVEEVFPVPKNDWSIIEPCGYNALTLTTCHPVGSAQQRLVVRAKLVSPNYNVS